MDTLADVVLARAGFSPTRRGRRHPVSPPAAGGLPPVIRGMSYRSPTLPVWLRQCICTAMCARRRWICCGVYARLDLCGSLRILK
jgi:hypothetical protein